MPRENDSTDERGPESIEASETRREEIEELIEKVRSSSIKEWYRERTFTKNLREGKPWRNEPNRIPDPEEHFPHQLVQCHRKVYYRQHNAPEEGVESHGVLWSGTRLEEDIVVPYLEWLVPTDYVVGNSFWVEYDITVDGTELTMKGSTDPLIVDRENTPRLLTEVKTKSSLEHLDGPDHHHKAQAHAYLYGLSQKYDRPLTDAVLMYLDRKTFEIRTYHVPFDATFWRDSVTRWAATHTEYRLDESLPPGNPEKQWECSYCSYQNRCGKGESNYADTPPRGFLPLFVDYPRSQIQKYLQDHATEDAKLTPTLAFHNPDLADEFRVHDWTCTCCGRHHDWESVSWDGDVETPPLCPECRRNGIPAPLRGPTPSDQLPHGES